MKSKFKQLEEAFTALKSKLTIWYNGENVEENCTI